MPLVSHAPRPQMQFVVFARSKERRHGIHVRRERHHRLVPVRQHVVAVRLHLHALHVAAGALRERAKIFRQKHAHLLPHGA